MLQSDLLDLLGQEEGPKLEFKTDDLRPEQLAKEIVAFANMNGGKIVLGIQDKTKKIIGTERKNLQAWLMDTVLGHYVHPFINVDYEEVTSKGKKVAIVTVPQGSAKPYVLRHNKREEIYMRYGDTCQLATREQQARLFHQGGLVSLEKMPIHGSSLKDFDTRRLREYLVDIVKVIEQREWEKFGERKLIEELLRRDFMRTPEGKKEPVCALFAILLFGKEPVRWLPQSSFRVTVFPGIDKDYDTNLDISTRSPFVRLSPSEASSYSELSIPDRILFDLKSHISHEKLDGAERKRYWDFPEIAIRELLINAFAHRDWSKNTGIEVSVYSDRMEFISPGALPNGMTIDKIEAGQREPRNPKLIEVFTRLWAYGTPGNGHPTQSHSSNGDT